MLGTAVAQAIPILISPLLTRLYTPADFAVLSVFLSMMNTLVIAVTGRYELTIILPRSQFAARSLLGVTLRVTALMSALFLIVFLSWGGDIARLLGNPSLRIWLYLLPLALFLTGVNQAQSYWLTRDQKYGLISKGKFVQAISGAVLTVGLGFFPFLHGGLVIGNIVGVAACVAFTALMIYPSLKEYATKTVRRRLTGGYAAKYADFPKYNAVSTLIDSLGIYIPLWFISSAFSAELTGYYGLATRIIAIPLMLIGTSLTQVYFKKSTDLFNTKGDMYGFTVKLFRRFLVLTLPALVIFIFFAPSVFGIIFGARWSVAGTMSQYVALGIYVQVLISPFTVVFVIIGKLKALMIWQVSYCFANLSIVFLDKAYFGGGLYSFLTLYTIMNVLMYAIYMLMIIYLLKNHHGLVKAQAS